MEVYDIFGRQMVVLADDIFAGGSHELTWDTREFPTGVYFVIVRGDSDQGTQSLTVVR